MTDQLPDNFNLVIGDPLGVHVWEQGTVETYMIPTGLFLDKVMIDQNTLEIFKQESRLVTDV